VGDIVYMIGAVLLASTGAYFFLYLYYSQKLGTQTVPSSTASRKVLVQAVRELLDAGDLPGAPDNISLVDVGSGAGGLTERVARALPDITVCGIELSPLPCAISALRQKLFGPKNLSYRRHDFFTTDLSNFSIAVLYMDGHVVDKISPHLFRVMPPGAALLSIEFPVPENTGWRLVATHDVRSRIWAPEKIYVYRKI